MSSGGYDRDGFKIVISKRRKDGAKKSLRNSKISSQTTLPEITDVDSVIRTINNRKLELSSSRYCQQVSNILNSNFSNLRRITCYGLGNFGSCSISSYQLALLLNIRDQFQCQVWIYDPAFLESEKKILRDFGFNIIDVNEEGKFKASEATLFYMIHCGKPLYNNVLWANWDPSHLCKVAILGNSFNHISSINTGHYLSTKLRYVHLILPATTEIEIPNTFKRDDIFNNTSLHLFKDSDTKTLDKSLWLSPKEPRYDSDDEIIRKVDALKLKSI